MSTELLFAQLTRNTHKSLLDIWDQTISLHETPNFTDWKREKVPLKGIKQSVLISTLQFILTKLPSISRTAISLGLESTSAISQRHADSVLENAKCLRPVNHESGISMILEPPVKARIQLMMDGNTPSIINPDICSGCTFSEFCASYNLYANRPDRTLNNEQNHNPEHWIQEYVFDLVQPVTDPTEFLITKFASPSNKFKCPGSQIPELVDEFRQSHEFEKIASELKSKSDQNIKITRINNLISKLYSGMISIKNIEYKKLEKPEFESLSTPEKTIFNQVFTNNIINQYVIERLHPDMQDGVEDIQETMYQQCQNLFWLTRKNTSLGDTPHAIEYIANNVVSAILQDHKLYWSNNYDINQHLKDKEVNLFVAFHNFVEREHELTPEKIDYYLGYPEVYSYFAGNQIDAIENYLRSILKKRKQTLDWKEISNNLRLAYDYFSTILGDIPYLECIIDTLDSEYKSTKLALRGGNSNGISNFKQERQDINKLKDEFREIRSLFGEEIQVHIAAFSGLPYALKAIKALEGDEGSRLDTIVLADKKGIYNQENVNLQRTPLIVDVNVSSGRTIRAILKELFDLGHNEALIYIAAPVQHQDRLAFDGVQIKCIDKQSHLFIAQRS